MESWPFTFPQEHLSRDESLLLWDVVDYVRRDHIDVFRRFLRERTIYGHVFEYLAQADRPTFARIVSDLRRRAAQEAIWLVDVPLLNLIPPRETVAVANDAMLVRTDSTRRAGRHFGTHLRDAWAVQNHLGDELRPRSRWLTGSQQVSGLVDVDTRAGASLLLVEEGIEEVALNLAGTRARLAVALWCLLSPPRSSRHPRQSWPTVGGWLPAPYIESGIQRKRYRPGTFGGPAGVRDGLIRFHGQHRLTRSENYLRAPFVAIEAARKGGLAARAVLSAARSLYLAERIPTDLEGTERILHVWRAKEALSHDPGPRGGRAEARWSRLVVNLRLRSELRAGGYSREAIDEAFRLMKSLRDLATHMPDDVLVDLDYPTHMSTQLRHGRVIDATVAPLAVVAADWPVLRAGVRLAARRLAKGAIRNRWNDRWFHSRFA